MGHTGTLDPDATGLLILCLGYATRLAEYLSAGRKTYETEVLFGIETDTEDTSGQIVRRTPAAHLTRSNLESVLPKFRGEILQVPPMVSALHYEGKRLHELAREGIILERDARPITIYELTLNGFTPGENPVAALTVACSSGTYIRTLAADIGGALGVGGAMQFLRRTSVSNGINEFSVELAYSLETLDLLAEEGKLGEAVLSVGAALSGWAQVSLDTEAVLAIKMGKRISVEGIIQTALTGFAEHLPVAVRDTEETVFAIAHRETDGTLQPVKVLIPL